MSIGGVAFGSAASGPATFDEGHARMALRATVRAATPPAVREALGRLAERDSELLFSLRFQLDDARRERRLRAPRGASAQRSASSLDL